MGWGSFWSTVTRGVPGTVESEIWDLGLEMLASGRAESSLVAAVLGRALLGCILAPCSGSSAAGARDHMSIKPHGSDVCRASVLPAVQTLGPGVLIVPV